LDEAAAKLDEAHYDVLILDNIMPGRTGLEWLAEQRRQGLFADAIMITAYADLETAIAALRAGVSDFVLKPFRANQIIGALERTLDRKYLRRDNTLMRRELTSDQAHGPLLGNSLPMEQVRDFLRKLAQAPAARARNWPHGIFISSPTGRIGRLCRSIARPLPRIKSRQSFLAMCATAN
jgi:DNA-binding NtrC family response regulator